MCAYVHISQPFTKWQHFEGGIYWEDLPEIVVTFQGNTVSTLTLIIDLNTDMK